MSKLAILSMGALASMSTAANAAQRIAVPSYIYPGPEWTLFETSAPTVGIAIINPASGPGEAIDPNYQRQIKEAQTHGIKVLGYVTTSYANRDLAKVEREIDTFEAWYHVDGIFLDEAANSPSSLPYYAALKTHIVKLNQHALTIINPGTETIEGYMAVADIVLTFEGSFEDYQSKYHAPDWVSKYKSNRFWHVVYKAATVDDMKDVVRLSKERNAGWVYVTSELMPNPYGKMPAEDYWLAQVKAVR